jgi:diguanylate cyclase (GGDEF)-like protein
MNPFLSVRFRLFALCVGLLAVMGGANLLLAKIIIDREPQEIEQQDQYRRVQTIYAVYQAVNDYRYWQSQVNSAVLVKNDAWRAQAEEGFAGVQQHLTNVLREMERFDPVSVSTIQKSLNALPDETRTAVEALAGGRQADANALYSRVRERIETIQGALKAATEREQIQAEVVQRTERERAANAVRWSIVVLVASTAVGLLLSYFVLRSIVRPLRTTVSAIRMVNAGETSVDMPPVSSDEFGDIAIALRQFRDQAERLRRLAYCDPLTGLGNRAQLEESLRGALEMARQDKTKVALVYLDLDNFSTVNDSLGHSAGDRYICEAVERLQRFVPEDATVCRYGGDKFTVLLPGIPDWDAETLQAHLKLVTAHVLRGLAEPFQLGADVLPMSVSVGVAVFPADGETGEQLVSAADAAMYLAKRSGRNNAQFASPELTGDARRNLTLISDIRRGLDSDEFEPFYQPVVDVSVGQVVGAEALLRWRHPQRGIVMAGEFMPAAEASGLIHALGEQCIVKACSQAEIWCNGGLDPIRISVNLSARQIEDQTAILLLKQLHEGTSAAGARGLDFEITETAILQQLDRAQETLKQIRSLGHNLSVDDFGTGYSSMVYLQRFPVNRIKIDRSFVARVETSREAQAIISATVVLAQSLDLEVVAEGVETEGQLRRLQSLGCTLQQGYFFTPALPAGEFDKWRSGERHRYAFAAAV